MDYSVTFTTLSTVTGAMIIGAGLFFSALGYKVLTDSRWRFGKHKEVKNKPKEAKWMVFFIVLMSIYYAFNRFDSFTKLEVNNQRMTLEYASKQVILEIKEIKEIELIPDNKGFHTIRVKNMSGKKYHSSACSNRCKTILTELKSFGIDVIINKTTYAEYLY